MKEVDETGGFWGPTLFGVALALALVGVSCSVGETAAVVEVPESVASATFVGNAACADCHADVGRQFHSSPHGRFYNADMASVGSSGCESCHGPGSEHVATGGQVPGKIFNPRRNPESCLNCHLYEAAQFRLPHRHPVMEGQMSCVDCHDPHGTEIFKPSGGLAMARRNQQCAQCHQEQTRPVIFQHEAMREGCIACHNQHGSINDKMLAQPDANLCLRCHAQVAALAVPGDELVIGAVPHQAFLSQGTCWTAGCHTAVHGSNVNPKLLQ